MKTITNFDLGSKIVLFESPIYNLKTTITRKQNKTIKWYKTVQDLFELSFSRLDSSKDKIGLSFDKINFLEHIIESFFDKIIVLYKSVENNLKFQLDLTLGIYLQ